MKKTIGKKIFWFVLTFLLLETLLILAIVSINTLSQYKLDITTSLLIDQYQATFTQLGAFIQSNWQERNMFFLGGTIAGVIYSLYTTFKSNFKKEGWETEDRNTYHGSAKWGTPSDIFKTDNFVKYSKASLLTQFEEKRKGKVN